MKKTLGLDLGTNSIGWAIVCENLEDRDCPKKIEAVGSRIIPMDAATMSEFDKGVTKSQTAERTGFRSTRRLRERHLLRRERLHRVLAKLGFLPEHYRAALDIKTGKMKNDVVVKLPWRDTADGKAEFIFQESFQEMLADMYAANPQLKAHEQKVPYDWTIYYLRHKALTEKISREELAWLLLNFNRKRGYYQLRGEDEEKEERQEEYHALKVMAVEATDEKKGKDTWYKVHLENGWIYSRASSAPLDWVGTVKEFIVTKSTHKDGSEKLSFRAPKDDDWNLRKKKTENDIATSGKTVGAFIYESLLKDPSQKIKGDLITVIERKCYKDELKQILERQTAFHSELQNDELYEACIKLLYPQNEAHQRNVLNRGFSYLFIDDILFYQRPLKTKKSLIDNCSYETTQYIDQETGEIKKAPVKCIAKSHPLYQEFRVWLFIQNLQIYQRERYVEGKLRVDYPVTNELLRTDADYVALFDWLCTKEKVDQDMFLKYPPFGLKKKMNDYRWNYVEDKSYPMNETKSHFLKYLHKAGMNADFLTRRREEALWHLLYSIEDKTELEKALHKFALREGGSESFVEVFKKFPAFKKEYGAYSAKALKKMLPLMRVGKYWAQEDIEASTMERITKIMLGDQLGIAQESAVKRLSELTVIDQFQRLPLWLVCYIVYGRHSEAANVCKWHNPGDITTFLKDFKQHSLRNPIVEQVVMETLRVVHDVWLQCGQLDEIHIELGREMKNPADVRLRMSNQNRDNEQTNFRIKTLLMEFMNPEFGVKNVRPFSPNQQEILRLYEEEVLTSTIDIPEDIQATLKKFREIDAAKRPTTKECLRYKLWLEQRYRSPYTGKIIPLGELFTPAYEIEHIIPQSRYFDDSMANKVICETEVNRLKGAMLGYEFIKECRGTIVALGNGKTVRVFAPAEYEQFVQDHYSKLRGKLERLLMEEIPEKFVDRQLNDSRYISKYIKFILSNIVRVKSTNGEYEPEAVSKMLISCTGGVTDRLKRDWGIYDVWNRIVYPRFEKLNEKTGTNNFGHWANKEGKRYFQIEMPLELQRGFNKKRIDHRHHAMDAIVIACASRDHVNYLNNESARRDAKRTRSDLRKALCKKYYIDAEGNYQWLIAKPWESFTQDVYAALLGIVVSFKQNLRIINRATNFYQHYDAHGKKGNVKQEGENHWAIRKSLHKGTVQGRVNLRKVKTERISVTLEHSERIVDKALKKKINELRRFKYTDKMIIDYFKGNVAYWKELDLAKIPIYYFTDETTEPMAAVRKSIGTHLTEKRITETVTDSGIQKILLRHLKDNGGNPELAFSPDGIERMNQNIITLNDGKFHQPIYKVRIYETLGRKFPVGETGCKKQKFVEADRGTNLYFAIYVDEEGKRIFESVPFIVCIERLKQGLSPVPDRNADGYPLQFILSPNDLVYLPTDEEKVNGVNKDALDKSRIYKCVSFTTRQCFFVPSTMAYPIVNNYEYSVLNKLEKSIDGEMIKEHCIPIKVDRLGNIVQM